MVPPYKSFLMSVMAIWFGKWLQQCHQRHTKLRVWPLQMWWMVFQSFCITHQTVITFPLTHRWTVKLQGDDIQLYLTSQSVSQSANHPAVAQAARLSGKRVSQSTSNSDSEFYNTATRQVSESKRQSAGQGSAGIDGTGTKPVWAPRGDAVVIHLPASLNLNASLAWDWYSTSPYHRAKNILAKCGVLC